MGITNRQAISSSADNSHRRGLWHRAIDCSDGWKWLTIAVVVVAAGLGLAIGQHWIAFADLTPLLYVAPCAAMMFMCMRSMNKGGWSNAVQSSVANETPAASDIEK